MRHDVDWEAFFRPALHEALLGELICAYEKRLCDMGCGHIWQAEKDAAQRLWAAVEEEQAQGLRSMIAHFQSCARFALPFGFSRGLCAAFAAGFDAERRDELFGRHISSVILRLPSMREHPDFYEARSGATQSYESLEAAMDAENAEHLLSIFTAWDNRVYGVFYNAFSLGWDMACSLERSVRAT